MNEMLHRNGSYLLSLLLSFCFLIAKVNSHGRLMEPPARNAMWRFGYPNPINYNDNELFCGGYAVQWEQNLGKCGVCGDAYNIESPRPHEAGGDYARGYISRRYSAGQEVEIEIELTANHFGRFELYLCPNNNPSYEATQECFDRYPLYLSGTRDVGFTIPGDSLKSAVFKYNVMLPPYVTCTQCVLQWTYFTGNMWGYCANGTESVGCGKPETFRNCADVSIISNTGGGRPPIFADENQRQNPFLIYYRDNRAQSPRDLFPLVIRDQVCLPTPEYRIIPGMDKWCQENCLHYPPNCPENICHCPKTCDAIGEIEGKEGADVYCLYECIKYPTNCPAKRCRCY